jgi:SAM-dependent methyltransferase
MEYQPREYLRHLGISGDYAYEMVPCELCGGTDFRVVRDEISIGRGEYGILPVQVCEGCGFLMQNPRFEREFYRQFYRSYYRLVIKQSTLPSKDFIDDQIQRGRNLLSSCREHLGDPGRMLDVGCSAGGMLLPFREEGWDVYGMDPDTDYVKYGQEELGLSIDYMDGEDMDLNGREFDFIIIMGSLEHVRDPNTILEHCRRACSPASILLMEGRFRPLGHSRDYFNHNHHRYLRKRSLEKLEVLRVYWSRFRPKGTSTCSSVPDLQTLCR